MRKTIVVAVREFQASVRTKAFIITVLFMPILWGGMIGVQFWLKDKVDTRDRRVAVVDLTGRLFDAVADAARKRNETAIFKGAGEGAERKQVKPRFLVERVEPRSDDPNWLTYELSERVRKNDLFAFLIIGPDVIEPGGDPTRASINYYSNTPTYEDFQDWVVWPINERIQQLRVEAAKLDMAAVKNIVRWVPSGNLGLVALDDQGRPKPAEKTNEIATKLVPVALMMLMLMVVMVGASPLTNSVLEEKMQRIAEVLLGCTSPFQLMMGKLLGTVGVSLTLGTLYLGGAFIALTQTGFAEFFPTRLIWWFVAYQALAVLLYGSVFIAVGAAVSELKEAQTLLTPVMLIIIGPMIVWPNILREPTAPFSVGVSLFPPATPVIMILRQAIPPGVPLWQPVLGIILVLLTTVFCVFAAGRIFRVGILMQGKGAKMGELLRWIVRG
jgi:ABC-2 type transport system permease protein